MVITRTWLHEQAAGGRGWTRAQLQVLGVGWPPRAGWLSAQEGRTLTAAQAAAFVAARRVLARSTRLKWAKRDRRAATSAD